MANPTCSTATLITNTPCFSSKVLSPRQQKALSIWFRANELSVIGGTNYTNLLTTTLLTDAQNLVGTMTDAQLRDARLAIDYNNAVNAGATISTNIQTLMGNIKCLVNVNDRDLDEILVTLDCKLGRHKAYPQ